MTFVDARDVNGATVTVPETWVRRWPDRFKPVKQRKKTSTPAVAEPAERPETDETPAGDVPEEE